MGADYSFYAKSIATRVPTFLGYIISVLASVYWLHCKKIWANFNVQSYNGVFYFCKKIHILFAISDFLVETMTSKSAFENNWPLTKTNSRSQILQTRESILPGPALIRNSEENIDLFRIYYLARTSKKNWEI